MHLLAELTSSRLAFDRESEAITSPSRMTMPRQYVYLASVSNALVFGLAENIVGFLTAITPRIKRMA